MAKGALGELGARGHTSGKSVTYQERRGWAVEQVAVTRHSVEAQWSEPLARCRFHTAVATGAQFLLVAAATVRARRRRRGALLWRAKSAGVAVRGGPPAAGSRPSPAIHVVPERSKQRL